MNSVTLSGLAISVIWVCLKLAIPGRLMIYSTLAICVSLWIHHHSSLTIASTVSRISICKFGASLEDHDMHLIYQIALLVVGLSLHWIKWKAWRLSFLQIVVDILGDLASDASADQFAVSESLISEERKYTLDHMLEAAFCTHSDFIWKYLSLNLRLKSWVVIVVLLLLLLLLSRIGLLLMIVPGSSW